MGSKTLHDQVSEKLDVFPSIEGQEGGAMSSSQQPNTHSQHRHHDDVDYDELYSLREQKRIIRRVDVRLITMLGCLYVISLVDRINISTAAIAGLNADLGLQIGTRYSIIISIFFVAYTIFQPLGTILTRRLRPRFFLSSITLAWGLVMIGNGFVKSWQSLAGLRVLIGVFEAGFFPGAVYLLSTWYTRFDMQKRYVAFYTIGCVAGSLGGILAFGLGKMDGLAGLRGWRWIFIVEGVISCLVGILSYVFLVDFPEEADRSWRFLSTSERDFIVRRVNRDRADAVTEPFSWTAYLEAATDVKVWVFAFMFFCVTTVGYSINYFLPIILVGMGFSVAASQCLIVPPWIFTGLLMWAQAWLSDRYRLRGPIIVFNAILALVGLALMGFHHANPVRYTGVFFVMAGASGNTPPVLTYQANNIRGHWKRAFCSATLIGFGGIGGIAGALVFRSQDQPKYLPGIYASIACNVCLLLCVAGLSLWFWFANQRARRGVVVLEGLKDFTYTY
ncbi:Major facilitator superfamily domain, general substrate transporter [Moelleriella libera RCEF 2490]|uniref:Major facilitator superfamily domain, general substrate transporter n=1 Tax=Moelleriella libera RCEF 2490 TaxID=1081109 RepID=A0A168ARI5_9HYPO|nr:Major facilitator superfamily domain, general substrate transporter [Moelleriella libera RCEF 2490]